MAETIYLKEDPFFFSDRACVCIHAAGIDVPPPEEKKGSCDVFKSCELDILSHRFIREPLSNTRRCKQARTDGASVSDVADAIPLFYTRRYKQEPIKAVLNFPPDTTLVSEGRTVIYETDRIRVNVQILISYTYFKSSKTCVWHICIQPADNEIFDEFVIVKLLKLCDSAPQESCNLKEHISFSDINNQEQPFEAYISSVTDKKITKEYSIKTATVSVGSFTKNCHDIDHIFRLLHEWASGDANASDRLQELFEMNGNDAVTPGYDLYLRGMTCPKRIDYRNFLRAFAGIASGILDFRRYSFTELTDTIKPFLNESNCTMVIFHKNILCSIGYQDDLHEVFGPTHGLNPYMLIPHAVVIHNEIVLENALEKLEEAMLADSAGVLLPDPRKAEKCRAEAEKNLSIDLLPDVFHYPYEAAVYSAGSITRGIGYLKQKTRTGLRELKYRIDENHQLFRKKSDIILNILLVCLSVIQAHGVLFMLLGDWNNGFSEHPGWWWYIFAGMLMTLLALTYIILKRQIKQKIR